LLNGNNHLRLKMSKRMVKIETLKLIKVLVLSQPQGYLVHRDFHSRNIRFKRGRVSVIDYQDA